MNVMFFSMFWILWNIICFFFFWEISGPQVEKYQDHHVKDHLDPDSKDYIKRDEGEERL
jgi:TM2 domain-containing membrane protein YozV